MTRTEKKRIRRKLINFQNSLGKVVGRAAWIVWKETNKVVKNA